MSTAYDYVIHFEPDTIWVKDLERPAGWWTVQPIGNQRTFTGPFLSMEAGEAWLREEYCGPNMHLQAYIDRFADRPGGLVVQGPRLRVSKTLRRVIEERAEGDIEHGMGGTTDENVTYVRKFVARCLSAILLEHPREDLRIVLQEKIDGLGSD